MKIIEEISSIIHVISQDLQDNTKIGSINKVMLVIIFNIKSFILSMGYESISFIFSLLYFYLYGCCIGKRL